MTLGELVGQNLASPAVLAFVLGAVAVRLKSDLRFPESITSLLSTYLLLAIGLKGGLRLRDASLDDLVMPIIATVALGIITPTVSFFVARKFLRFTTTDAAAIAAHYGSVSAVTFTAAETFARSAGTLGEEYLAALVALLEVPGIIVALVIASRALGGKSMKSALHEVVTGRSIVLLIGGVAIGLIVNGDSAAVVEPLFVGLFPGVLVLFLLDLGVLAGERLERIRAAGWRLIVYAIALPVLFGVFGALAGTWVGLSVGGVTVLATMTASASYIAAPAAVRVGLPDADQGLVLGAALGVTFPFNLVLGIPLYAELASRLA
ncbi:MAG: sodium-dependent bicarbonate transport family permease [Actinobacteria bacterium]|nr:sodium-dependent bicarbonate transport family permease [Actinomycetota bacterium]NCW91254.1 sodium-dependent bicarbonate transport family permease [Acidimicrobiia bacterium]NCV09080.1 sodium-dependent bicarbonate transport family permease [Actinomycetota bacterium]NDD17360.1 sodium-dependent bicarbonate transport family permease [Acidimicrobiia bacterium]NDE51902.1 sodium-dependent bicarbonate transport family permease [Actinomycetota bacterium]